MAPNVGNHIPAGVKVVSFTAQWAGTDIFDPHNQFDVCMLGDDGQLYHLWYQSNVGWSGPERLNALD